MIIFTYRLVLCNLLLTLLFKKKILINFKIILKLTYVILKFNQILILLNKGTVLLHIINFISKNAAVLSKVNMFT